MGRFQALTKQLNLEAEEHGETTKTHYPRFA
jgi:hypothetical protein